MPGYLSNHWLLSGCQHAGIFYVSNMLDQNNIAICELEVMPVIPTAGCGSVLRLKPRIQKLQVIQLLHGHLDKASMSHIRHIFEPSLINPNRDGGRVDSAPVSLSQF